MHRHTNSLSVFFVVAFFWSIIFFSRKTDYSISYASLKILDIIDVQRKLCASFDNELNNRRLCPNKHKLIWHILFTDIFTNLNTLRKKPKTKWTNFNKYRDWILSFIEHLLIFCFSTDPDKTMNYYFSCPHTRQL